MKFDSFWVNFERILIESFAESQKKDSNQYQIIKKLRIDLITKSQIMILSQHYHLSYTEGPDEAKL